MKWFKFETEDQRYKEHEPEGMLVYLGPEALKHAIVVNDFEVFQSSPECVPGGRLLEVSRQFSYRLRQVADLVEEPLEQHAETEIEPVTVSKKRGTNSEISAGASNYRRPIGRNLLILLNSHHAGQKEMLIRLQKAVPF